MPRIRFGLFDFDPETGELARNGQTVHLQAQPAKVLALLLAARGGVVSRDEIRAALWNDGTTVDFDRSLNFAIGQVRTALGDSADSPTFIRTVPKRGYQFIAPIREQGPEEAIEGGAAPEPAMQARDVRSRRWLLQFGLPFAGIAAAIAYLTLRGKRPSEPRVAVARFQNETGDRSLDEFADHVTDLVVTGLTSETAGRLGVIGNASILRQPRSFQHVDEIGAALGVDYVILGQVKQEGATIRVLAHLIRLPEKTHLKVSRIDTERPVAASTTARRIVTDLAGKLNSSHPPAE